MNMITNHLPTAELQALDAAHHVHPFTHNAALAKKGSRVITRARGVTLTDSDGNEMLDAMAGLWCVNVGYGREELAEVAARQMRELPYYNAFFQTTHVPAIALAQKLSELAPGDLNHTFFAAGGSEANDTNIRLVRTYWDIKGKPTKKVIISRKNGYHGSSVGSASLGGMPAMHAQGGIPIPDIHHIGQPNWWAEGGDMDPDAFGLKRAQELEDAILEMGEDRVAAFIAEPIQGAGGVIVPPQTYWPEIQRICDKYEILLIADEVITGFGRTGNWFGSQTFGIRPDIMTIAKGLSSGYAPIGGSILSDEVAQVISSEEFNHGYTYSGHPVAAAVALENLRILEEEKILDHVRDVAAPYLREKWLAMVDHPLIGEAKIVGMMGSIQMTPDKESRAGFAAGKGTAGDRMIISPPLILTHGDIDTLIARATRSLDETHAALKADGLLKAA